MILWDDSPTLWTGLESWATVEPSWQMMTVWKRSVGRQEMACPLPCSDETLESLHQVKGAPCTQIDNLLDDRQQSVTPIVPPCQRTRTSGLRLDEPVVYTPAEGGWQPPCLRHPLRWIELLNHRRSTTPNRLLLPREWTDGVCQKHLGSEIRSWPFVCCCLLASQRNCK